MINDTRHISNYVMFGMSHWKNTLNLIDGSNSPVATSVRKVMFLVLLVGLSVVLLDYLKYIFCESQ